MIGEMVGSYRVQTKLGEGGMGVVYIAEHPLLRKKAVVKFLHAQLSSNTDVVERFFNEARSATMIRHPGIVDVFDFGHHASGCAFILMEFLDGESLAARVKKSILSAPVAIVIGRQIASALAAAHEQPIIHRDLKPDNIFLVPDAEAPGAARIKVLDFGIAKLAGDTAGAVKTQTGAVMGTPSYMAPEQCQSAGRVDGRADIYSLGCILFELVCGRPPFRAQSLGQLIAAHMFAPPPAPSSFAPVPPNLEAVILRALAKDPGERQQSMAELSAQLAAYTTTGSIDVWAGVARPARAQPTPASPTPASPGIVATVAGHGPAGTLLAPGAVAVPIAPALHAATLPPTQPPSHRTTLGSSAGQFGGGEAASKRSRRRWWLGATTAAVLSGVGIVAWQLVPSDSPDGTRAASTSPSDASVAGAHVPPLPPPPVIPANITIVIESEPPGADVYREHDGIRVGQTRFECSVAPVAGGKLGYLLKREGYEDERVEFDADRDGKQTVKLKPRPTKPEPSTKTDRPKTGSPRPKIEPPRHPPKPCPPGMLCPK